jgi:hypothetical protein
MVQRIKLNGFSICDGEFVCYGVGIYHPANFMNHSCQPNALQVFLFQQSQLPSLFVTAFEDIPPNQEICISYTDTSCPTHIRRKQLRRNYFFRCTCDLCCNIQDDAIKMGILCPDCNDVVTRTADFSTAPLPPFNNHKNRYYQYQCDQCGRTGFDSIWKLLDRIEEEEEGQQHYYKNSSSDVDLEKLYNKIKKTCGVGSWYFQEAGEQLLKVTLNQLSEQANNPTEEQKVAWKALKLAEELLMVEQQQQQQQQKTISHFLQRQQLKYKAAKLRTFLIPDPRQSIKELEEILKEIQLYYPPNHEFLIGLRASLRNAMMMM